MGGAAVLAGCVLVGCAETTRTMAADAGAHDLAAVDAGMGDIAGGGGSWVGSPGGNGGVRVIWRAGRSFPDHAGLIVPDGGSSADLRTRKPPYGPLATTVRAQTPAPAAESRRPRGFSTAIALVASSTDRTLRFTNQRFRFTNALPWSTFTPSWFVAVRPLFTDNRTLFITTTPLPVRHDLLFVSRLALFTDSFSSSIGKNPWFVELQSTPTGRTHAVSAIKPPPGAPNTSPATATPVAGPALVAHAPQVLTALQWRVVEDAANAFHDSFVVLQRALQQAIVGVPGEAVPRKPTVSERHKKAAGLYAALVRDFADVAATVDPDVIDAGLAVEAALAVVRRDLASAIPSVEATGRQAARAAWSLAGVVRSAEKARPVKGVALASRLALIEATLRQGPRVTTSAKVAAKAQTTAAKAQQRATRARIQAERAAQVAERVAQAHAANHLPLDIVPVTPADTKEPTTTDPATAKDTKPKT